MNFSKRLKENNTALSLVLMVSFFAGFIFFQYWLEPQSDFPRKDEYQSLLSALDYPVYSANLYVHFLRLWTGFFPDFFSLWRFNFFASHLSLAVAFFLYHSKKGIALSTNFFITSLLVLSTINIALTRKMHFWGAAFFFILLFAAEYFKPKMRLVFLTVSLLILGFFRFEFFFSAIVAAALCFHQCMKNRFHPRHYRILFGSLFFFLLVIVIVCLWSFGYGMKALLVESLQLDQRGLLYLPMAYAQLFFRNILFHVYYSFYALVVPFWIYFPGLALSCVYLLFLKRNWYLNWVSLKQNLKTDLLPFYFSALFALYSVRFTDFYLIMTFLLLLSVLGFMLNTDRLPLRNLLVSLFILPSFFLFRPELKGSAYINFPTFKREVRIHRHMFDLIKNLNVSEIHSPYKILIDQYVTGVLPDEGREYFMFSDLSRLCERGPVDFDLVLLPGDWTLPPEQPLIEKCVLPRLNTSRHLKPSPGYDLFVSPRILNQTSAEKMSVK